MTYTLPPEWARQSAVMLTWPHLHDAWAKWMPEVETVFVAIAQQIARREQVLIVHYDADHRTHIARLLAEVAVDPAFVHYAEAKSNDIWVRDYGPLTVLDKSGKALLLNFKFNAWGGKYHLAYDHAITGLVHDQGGFSKTEIREIDFILEGGGIEVDGHGTLLTTESVVLANTRNEVGKAQLEALFQEWFGVKRVLWLSHGSLAGDDTDGHIDTLARFTDPHTICYSACLDPTHPDYEALEAMRQELSTFVDYRGEPYRLVPLPIPQPVYSDEGDRLPATYANFLIINQCVLLPVYGDPMDAIALARVQACFPERQVVPIHCRVLVQLFGSLHCASMQIPEGVLPR